jgi:HD-like signal output (HDOD) protein
MANMSKIDGSAVEARRVGTLSNTGIELLQQFSVPEPDLDHIVQLIDNEPGLAADVLRRSNSVVFAGHTPTRDVFEAVTRIGMVETRDTALNFIDPLHAWSPRPVTSLPAIRELFLKFKTFRRTGS